MPSAVDLCLVSDLGATESETAAVRAVTAASRSIARLCGRPLEKVTGWVEYPRGYGRPLLVLDRSPILAIASVTELGSVLDASAYETFGELAEAGLVYRKNGVWALTQRLGGRITDTVEVFQGESGAGGLTVVYDAGYVTPGQHALNGALTVTLPEDLQQAAVLVAAGLYKRGTLDPHVAAESLGDWSVTYRGALASLMTPEVEELLAPYSRPKVY